MEKSVLRELTKLQRVSVPAFGLTGSGFTGFGLTGPGFTGVPPFVPSMPKLFDYGRKSKGGGRKFKGRYAPSVAAIGLGIKAFKIPKSYKAGFGSLAIRPLIVSKSKKSKRRKK